MVKYMRDQFPFLGIPTPERRALTRAVLRDCAGARRARARDVRPPRVEARGARVPVRGVRRDRRVRRSLLGAAARRFAVPCHAQVVVGHRRRAGAVGGRARARPPAAPHRSRLLDRRRQHLARACGAAPPAPVQDAHRQRPALPLLPPAGDGRRVLPAQGDRVGAARVLEDGRGRGATLRRRERGSSVAVVTSRSAALARPPRARAL